MLEKLKDLLKEVFWLRKSGPKKKAVKSPKGRKAKAVKKAAPNKPLAKRPAAPSKAKAAPKPAKPAKPSKWAIDPNLTPVGEITHYFDRIKVAVVKITQGTILIGDRLTIAAPAPKGAKGPLRAPFAQKIWSMQIESQDVKVAKKGQLIGIKVDKPVTVGDIVYK